MRHEWKVLLLPTLWQVVPASPLFTLYIHTVVYIALFSSQLAVLILTCRELFWSNWRDLLSVRCYVHSGAAFASHTLQLGAKYCFLNGAQYNSRR
jgi:hypothetical protein